MAVKKSAVMDEKKMRKVTGAFFSEHGTKILTASKVKAYYKEIGLRVDAELANALAKKLTQMMLDGALRCVGNKRGTVRPRDL